MAQQMNPVDPATALILQAMNQINPVTPEGRPTVAADVVSAASQMVATQISPSVGQAAQQAGIASQLDAMKIQKAQQALMNQAMAQGPEATGIAPMAGAIQMAEGGIVGYAGRDESYVYSGSTIDPETFARDVEMMNAEAAARKAERERRDEKERLEWLKTAAPEVAARVASRLQAPVARTAPTQEVRADVPPPPPPSAKNAPGERVAPTPNAPGLAKSTGPTFNELFKEFETLRKMPTTGTPEAALQRALADKAVEEQYIRARGGDPDLVNKMISEYGTIYSDQLAKIEARRAAAQERAEKGGIGAWLRGFRQMKGQGIGEGFRTATEAGEAFDETMRGRIERLEDMGLEVQRARMEKVNALKNQKYLTDIGDYRNAMKAGDAAADAARREQVLLIELKKSQASEYSQEARTSATLASQAADRAAGRAAGDQAQIEELYRLRLSTLAQGKPPTPEQMMQAREYALQTVRGAGSAARAGIAAGNLDLARQKLAESNPIYRLNQFTAQNPKATEAERSRAIQTMREIEGKAGLGGSAPVTGAEGQFKLVGVQPSPR